MDLATVIGVALGAVMILFGIISAGASLMTFVDIPSVVITLGGSISSTLTSFKVNDVVTGLKCFGVAMKEPSGVDPTDVIKQILEMANLARKEGLLALEESGRNLEDEFLRKGIMLVVDGTEADLVRAILETDMDATEARHKKYKAFWDKWGEMGPAWGMIGTLVGLVNMLKNLSDPSTIGPSMAVALLTTLYGSMIANWITGPIAAKLELDNTLEMAYRTVGIEGLLSIQAGENPRVIEEKLKCFLAPNARDGVGEGGGGE